MADNHSQTLLGAILTILAAVGLSSFIPWGVSNRPKAPESAGASTPPSAGYSAVDDAAERSVDERVLDPLAKFLNPPQTTPPTASKVPGPRMRLELEFGGGRTQDASTELRPSLVNALKGSAPGGGDWSTQFMIVTVPDPVDSAQGERIDLVLDTLQNALRLDQFVLDRYYLPWQSYREAARSGDGGSKRTYTREPGLLFFREANEKRLTRDPKHGPPRLLLVFLVGETPVFGIHKEAFTQSVKLIREVGACRKDLTIPVLAPYFSGSAGSLIQAVESNLPGANRMAGGPVFDIISGTATSVDPDRFSHPDVDFHTTVIPDIYVQNELIKYVSSQNTGGTPIAWLTESNTGYGNYGRSQDPKDGREENEGASLVVYPFPLHISRLRSIYESQRNEAQVQSPFPTPEQIRVGIPFNVVDTARDTPAPLAPGLTNAYDELMLAQIFRSIRDQDIRYVGITATDPRDVVFLADSLHKYCPDTQLLLTDSDQIYLHPDFRSDLHGALIGSTYPLFPKLQAWTSNHEEKATEPSGDGTGASPPQRNFLTFASGSQQGFYNAALALRRNVKSRLRAKTPPQEKASLELELSKLEMLDYGIPFEASASRKPPVWISVVGNDSFWPLKYVEFCQAVKNYGPTAKDRDPAVKNFDSSSRSQLLLYDPRCPSPPKSEDSANSACAAKAGAPKTQKALFTGSVSFPYDRGSLALILGLILFGLINFIFYFLGLDWGPASCFDRDRLRGTDGVYMRLHMMACMGSLCILLSVFGLLGLIPLLAEPWFGWRGSFSLPSAAEVIDLFLSWAPGLADSFLSFSYYLSVGFLAYSALSLWMWSYLDGHNVDLARAKYKLLKAGGSEEEVQSLRYQRRQNASNIRALLCINKIVLWAFMGGLVIGLALTLIGTILLAGKFSREHFFFFGKSVLSLGLIRSTLLAIQGLQAWTVMQSWRRREEARNALQSWRRREEARNALLPSSGSQAMPRWPAKLPWSRRFAHWIKAPVQGPPPAIKRRNVLGLIRKCVYTQVQEKRFEVFLVPPLIMFFLTFLFAELALPTWINNFVVFTLSVIVSGGLLTILYETFAWGKKQPSDPPRPRSFWRFQLIGVVLQFAWRNKQPSDPPRPRSFWRFQLIGVVLQAVLLVAIAVGARVYFIYADPNGASSHFLGHLVLLFERSTHLHSGVSLLTLAIFLTLAIYTWGFTQLRRSYLFHYYYPHFSSKPEVGPVGPTPETDPGVWPPETHPDAPTQWRDEERDEIRNTRERIDALVEHPTPTIIRRAGVWFILALLISVAWMGRLRSNAVPPFENALLSLLVWGGLCVFLFVWIHWLVHLILLMNQVSKLLYQFALLPMQSAFQQLPGPVAHLLGRLLYADRPRLSLCRIPVHYLERIVATYTERLDSTKGTPETALDLHWRNVMEKSGSIPKSVSATSKNVSEMFADLSKLTPDMTEGILTGADLGKRATAFITIQQELAEVSGILWNGLVAEWTTRAPRQAYPGREGPSSQDRDLSTKPDSASPPEQTSNAASEQEREARVQAKRWVSLVEEFMAIQIVIYLSQLIYQGRNLLYGLLAGSLLMLLAVLSYPLQPHQLLVSSCMMMVLIVGIVGVIIFVRMERDPLVTRITGKRTEGVQFDLKFFAQIAPFVIPVAFILISGLFPDTWRWLSTILGPWPK